jgi:hypothetical protein
MLGLPESLSRDRMVDVLGILRRLAASAHDLGQRQGMTV